MSGFFLNLNDATALNDSVVARLVKLADVYQPVITEAETNSADIEITKYICCAFVIVTAFIVGGFLLWKLIDHLANAIAGWFKRRWEVENIIRKHDSDLLGKLLDFQKETAFPYNEKLEKKSYEEKESKNYIETLASLLNITLPPKKHETKG